MVFETIQRSTTPLMIVNQILKHLETGKLKIGDKLPSERELCKMFGVGRSSVREAIRALVVMGNLEVIQGKGTFLSRRVEPGDSTVLFLEDTVEAVPLFDLMEAREILETKAVMLAADRVDKSDIQRIHKAITRMAESGDDIKAFYEADLEFHNALADATGNIVISEMMKVITRMVHKYRYRFMAVSYETKENTIASARQIVQALARGEGEKAAVVLLDHLGVVDTKLKNLISETAKGDKKAKSF